MLEHLQEEEQRLAASTSQEDVNKSQPAAGGKKDPKKDAKAAPKKGAVEDKNAPKAIAVDYPDVPACDNFVILEKEYNQMNPAAKAKKSVGVTLKKAAPAPPKEGQTAEQIAEEKKQNRKKELISDFTIHRSLESHLAVKLRFNQPEEVKEEKPPEPEPVAKGKKK